MTVLCTITDKQAKSAQLNADVDAFLARNNLDIQDVTLPMGFSAQEQTNWNNGLKPEVKVKAQETMRKIMAIATANSHVRKAPSRPKPPKSAERQAEENRLKKNQNARFAAIEAGEKQFTGDCKKHGQAIFRIYKEGKMHICRECARERDALKALQIKQKNEDVV